MCRILILLVVTISITTTDCAKLPSFFEKCKKSDPKINECLTRSTKAGFLKFAEGDNAYHIQKLNPLNVPFMHIDVNGGLTINLTNPSMSGYVASEITNVEIDFDKKTIKVQQHIPEFKVLSKYGINGRILILPINGNGELEVNYIEVKCTSIFGYDLVEQNKKEYMMLKSDQFIYEPSRVTFRLDNLFNGNKVLGDEMNKFLNENWKEVNEEIGTKLAEAVSVVHKNVVDSFLAKVPFSELFDE